MFNKNKVLGFWMLIAYQIFLLLKHSYEYWSLKTYEPMINIPPNVLDQIFIPHLDLIFYLELLTGLVATGTILITNRKRKVANNS